MFQKSCTRYLLNIFLISVPQKFRDLVIYQFFNILILISPSSFDKHFRRCHSKFALIYRIIHIYSSVRNVYPDFVIPASASRHPEREWQSEATTHADNSSLRIAGLPIWRGEKRLVVARSARHVFALRVRARAFLSRAATIAFVETTRFLRVPLVPRQQDEATFYQSALFELQRARMICKKSYCLVIYSPCTHKSIGYITFSCVSQSQICHGWKLFLT